MTGEWVPEFEGQRPPFLPGNRVSVGNVGPVTHGIWSARHVDPIADRLIEELLADDSITYLRAPRYAAGLRRWGTSEAKVLLLEQWVDGMSIEEAARSDRGQTSALELLRKWSVTAGNNASRLGLDPLSAAKLGKDFAQGRQADLASQLSQWRLDAESGAGQS